MSELAEAQRAPIGSSGKVGQILGFQIPRSYFYCTSIPSSGNYSAPNLFGLTVVEPTMSLTKEMPLKPDPMIGSGISM